MASRKKLRTVLLVVVSYIGLALVVLVAARAGVVTPQQAGLMVVALFGMYVGFGILIVVYRMISSLEELEGPATGRTMVDEKPSELKARGSD